MIIPLSTSDRQQFLWALNLPDAEGASLLERYGTRVRSLQTAVRRSNMRQVASLPGYYLGELEYICEQEHVRQLADLRLRTTAFAMGGMLSVEAIRETAEIAASVLGWDAQRKANEIAHAEAEMTLRSIRNAKPAMTDLKVSPASLERTPARLHPLLRS